MNVASALLITVQVFPTMRTPYLLLSATNLLRHSCIGPKDQMVAQLDISTRLQDMLMWPPPIHIPARVGGTAREPPTPGSFTCTHLISDPGLGCILNLHRPRDYFLELP